MLFAVADYYQEQHYHIIMIRERSKHSAFLTCKVWRGWEALLC